MNHKLVIIVVLSSIVPSLSLAQSDDHPQCNLYCGVSGGFTYEEVGLSRFGFSYGGNVLCNWGDQFLSMGYTRLSVLDLPFPGEVSNYGDSRFERFELAFGATIRLSRSHPLFKDVRLGATAGISYSTVVFVWDEIQMLSRKITTSRHVGLPVGVILSGPLGNAFFGGAEYKYHLVSHLKPYSALSFVVMVRVM